MRDALVLPIKGRLMEGYLPTETRAATKEVATFSPKVAVTCQLFMNQLNAPPSAKHVLDKDLPLDK